MENNNNNFEEKNNKLYKKIINEIKSNYIQLNYSEFNLNIILLQMLEVVYFQYTFGKLYHSMGSVFFKLQKLIFWPLN